MGPVGLLITYKSRGKEIPICSIQDPGFIKGAALQPEGKGSLYGCCPHGYERGGAFRPAMG
jgi:hypothetical protein